MERLLSVHARQTTSYRKLAPNALSIYQFLPAGADATAIRPIGLAVTALVILGLRLGVDLSRARLTTTRIALLSAASAFRVPLLLPSMHEHYFYLAEVLTVIAAFCLPRRVWPAPVFVQTASLLAYLHVLFPTEDSTPFDGGGPPPGEIPMPAWAPTLEFQIFATLPAIAITSVLWTTFREFRQASRLEGADTSE